MPFQTIILFSTLTAILLFAGWAFGGGFGLLLALISAILINGLSYWFSGSLVLRMYSAKPFHDRRVAAIVERLARNAKIPVPRLYIVESMQPNAFATGRDPKHSAIAVTRGILGLEDKELEGVLAHETSHIAHRDILVSSIAAVLAGTISFFAQTAYYSLFFGRSRENASILGLVFVIIFAPIAALIIRLAISRSREFKADFAGALLTKNPAGLISALRKISSATHSSPLQGNAATSHMWIVNPFKGDWLVSLFSTHPPLEARVERLEELKLH